MHGACWATVLLFLYVWPSCGVVGHTCERSNKLQSPSMCAAAPISTAKPNLDFKKWA